MYALHFLNYYTYISNPVIYYYITAFNHDHATFEGFMSRIFWTADVDITDTDEQ